MVVFTEPVKAHIPSLLDRGYFVRYITGDEHARSLLRDILHGNNMSAGRPHVIASGGLVFAVIDGSERVHGADERDCLKAINAVRSHQGRPPLREYTY